MRIWKPEGVVEFAAHFPKPGRYKAWGQFQRQGNIITVPVVLEFPGVQGQSQREGVGNVQ